MSKRKGSARARKGAASAAPGVNLDRLVRGRAVDPRAANGLSAAARAKVERLTTNEVRSLIAAHRKVSPRKRWQPDPDGSIF